jgi:hypothetical protein
LTDLMLAIWPGLTPATINRAIVIWRKRYKHQRPGNGGAA